MKKNFSLLLALLLLLTLLCGCGASAAKTESAVPAYDSSFSTNTGFAPEAPMEEPKSEDAKMDAAGGWAPAPDSNPEEEQTLSSALPAGVKLIYTAQIDLESTEFDAALAGLNALVAETGGYFENSSLSNYRSDYRYGSYIVRVPAARFDGFCAAVGELCQMNNISRSAEDVSEFYYDTESRLTTQQTKLARLQELLAQAESMEDIITLESAISDTELAIENLTGTLRKYDSLVGYATVNISLEEVYKLSEVEEPVIGFGAKLAAAFKTGCSRFADNVQYLLLDIARAWVGWLIFLVIAAVAVILVVRSFRRVRARRAGRPVKPGRRVGSPVNPPAPPAEETAAAPESDEKE